MLTTLMLGLAMAGPKDPVLELTVIAPGGEELLTGEHTLPLAHEWDRELGGVPVKLKLSGELVHDSVHVNLFVLQEKGKKEKELAKVWLNMYENFHGSTEWVSEAPKGYKGDDAGLTFELVGLWYLEKNRPEKDDAADEAPAEAPADAEEAAPTEDAPAEEAAAE